MKIKNNNALLNYCPRVLGLNDWNTLSKEDRSPNEMILKDVSGETEWEETNKCAVVRIISEKDYGDRILPFNFEKTLIHELLHLKFCLLGESGNDLQDRLVHQLIDDMAKALYQVKAGRNGNDGQ